MSVSGITDLKIKSNHFFTIIIKQWIIFNSLRSSLELDPVFLVNRNWVHNTHKHSSNLRSWFWSSKCGWDTEACAWGHSHPVGTGRIPQKNFHPALQLGKNRGQSIHRKTDKRECTPRKLWNTNPQHDFDIDAAGRTRTLQLKPLVHGEITGC